MLKTRKLISIALVIAIIATVLTVALVSTSAAGNTIYFTNNKGWDEVYAYAWEGDGGEGHQNAAWPGEAMTFHEVNGYGEDLYVYEVPEGLTNIVFNGGLDKDQTVDAVDFVTGDAYYPTDKNDDGKWELGHWDYSGQGQGGDDPQPSGADYYLIGYINGAEYGDGDDYATYGDYLFVDGQVTLEVTDETWVCVKQQGGENGIWYMIAGTDEGVMDTSATLTNTTTLEAGTPCAKLGVPVGTATFSLVENGDGTLTLSYTTEGGQEDESTAEPDPEDESSEEQTPETDVATITAFGETITAHVGDTIHLTATLDATQSIENGVAANVEGVVGFDATKLEITPAFTGKYGASDDERNAIMPFLKGKGTSAANVAGNEMLYSANFEDGYTFNADTVLLKLDFNVKAVGESEITHIITSFGDADNKIIEASALVDGKTMPTFGNVVTKTCPHSSESSEEPASSEEQPASSEEQPASSEEAESTEAQPESSEDTPAEGDKIRIYDYKGNVVDSKDVQVGDIVTVYSKLNLSEATDGGRLQAFNFNVTYPSDKLELQAEGKKAMCPKVQGMSLTVNTGEAGIIYVNGSIADPYEPDDEVTFTSDNDLLIKHTYKVLAGGVSDVKTNFVTLAGPDANKEIKKLVTEGVINADFGGQESFYEGDKPVDESTEAESSEAESTEAESSEQAESTGEAESTEQAESTGEAESTEAESTEETPSDKIFIRADGVLSEVQTGETYTYEYILDVNGPVCSLDATTYFDKDNLELISSKDDKAALFPIIGKNMTLNSKTEGRFKYNYSNEEGEVFAKDGDKEPVLITFQVKVTTETPGIYDIFTQVKDLAGADEHAYKKNNDVQDDNYSEYGRMAGLNPYVGPTPAESTEAESSEAASSEAASSEAASSEAASSQAASTSTIESTSASTSAVTTASTAAASSKPAASTNGKSSSNNNSTSNNSSSVKTGSTELAIVFLMILVAAAGVVMFTKKRKFD